MMRRGRNIMTFATQSYLHIVIHWLAFSACVRGNLSNFHCGLKTHNLDPENPLKVNTERQIHASAIYL
jgi:hypothetical protein